jgi:hypothetical protein
MSESIRKQAEVTYTASEVSLKEFFERQLHGYEKYFQSLIEQHATRNDQRFQAQEKAVSAALDGAGKAIDKAERATELRFAASNEFRQTLSDQAAAFIQRTEAESQFKTIVDRITLIEKWQAERAGISGQQDKGQANAFIVAGLFITFAAACAAVVGVFLRH